MALGSREPGARLTNDGLSPVTVRRNDARLLRRPNRPAATSRRAAEAGTGKADYRVVREMMASRVVICGHGHHSKSLS